MVRGPHRRLMGTTETLNLGIVGTRLCRQPAPRAENAPARLWRAYPKSDLSVCPSACCRARAQRSTAWIAAIEAVRASAEPRDEAA